MFKTHFTMSHSKNLKPRRVRKVSVPLKKKKPETPVNNDLYVYGVPKHIRVALFNISKNKGTSLSLMMRQRCREIVNDFPDELKEPYSHDNKREKYIRISSIHHDVKEKLSNISKNIGIDVSDFLKFAMYEFVNSFPDYMKQPPAKF